VIKVTEKEIRSMLEYALADKDADAARTAIQAAILGGVELHKMTDLHFRLMLTLAMPEPESRGRPKDPTAAQFTWLLNMACKIKSEITGNSFSKTWAEYCDFQTRPRITTDEIWRCAGILLYLVKDKHPKALRALSIFELCESDISPFYVVNK